MLDANLAIGIGIGQIITSNIEATTGKKRQVRRKTVIVVCSPRGTSDEEITASQGGEDLLIFRPPELNVARSR